MKTRKLRVWWFGASFLYWVDFTKHCSDLSIPWHHKPTVNFKDIIKEDFDENSENNDNDDDPDYNLVMRVSAKGQLISECLLDFF